MVLKTSMEMPCGRAVKVIDLYKKEYLWRAWKKLRKPLILMALSFLSEDIFLAY